MDFIIFASMKKVSLYVLLLLMATNLLCAQNQTQQNSQAQHQNQTLQKSQAQELNRLDEQGRKQGAWREHYADGTLRYKATFKDDYPVGEMIRYNQKGKPVARMFFSEEGHKSYVHLFRSPKKLSAEGIYRDKKKDSVWTYYAEVEPVVRMKESYEMGQLHGKEYHYYPSGQISEELNWDHGNKQGPWVQYYYPGEKRLKANYENDKLEGAYTIYHMNGTKKLSGQYINGLAEGDWTFYNEEGEEIYSLEYVAGQPADPVKYNKWVADSLDKYKDVKLPESVIDFQ